MESRTQDLWEKLHAEFGVHEQLRIAAEESVELAHAIMKYLRGPDPERRQRIIEEICDIEFTVGQVKRLIHIQDDELRVAREKTLQRANEAYMRSKQGGE